jgi:hypothetical protein
VRNCVHNQRYRQTKPTLLVCDLQGVVGEDGEDMTESIVLPLPERSVSLTNGGVQQLLAQARENPSVVSSVLAQLQSNPRAAITTLFNLSAVQQELLAQMSDAELAGRLGPAIQALQAGNLTGWSFSPPNMEPAVLEGGCNCFGKYTQ